MVRPALWRLLGILFAAYRSLPLLPRTPVRRLALRIWLLWVQRSGRETIGVPCSDLGGTVAIPAADTVTLTLIRFAATGEKTSSIRDYMTLGPKEVGIDVGAYVGYYSLLLSMRAPTARIVAIEPRPIHLACLEKNVRAFGAKNVIVIPKAASNGEGEAELICLGPESALRRPLDEPGEAATIRVPTVTLDRALAELGIEEVHLIKVNVEGAELEVLEGARRTIERSPRLRLLVAVHPWCGVALSDVTDFLAGLGFQLTVILPDIHPWVIAERAG